MRNMNSGAASRSPDTSGGRLTRAGVRLTLAAVVGTMSSAVMAQSSDDTEATVGDIVVTAERREQNLQKVPIAISAVTGETLTQSGVREAADLSTVIPSLTIQRNTTATIFFLRGVGTALGSPGLDSAIATFVDGVYIPSMTGSTFSLNNLERVEVLKGPQGTLYGRNATGGAVNLITRTPTHSPTLEASIGYGNLNTIDTSFYGSLGLNEKIAMDLAAVYHVQDKGFGTNLATGEDVMKSRDANIRSKIVADLTDTLQLTLSGDYAYTDGSLGITIRPGPTSTLLDGTVGYTGGFYDTNTDVQPFVKIQQYGGSAKLKKELGNVTLQNIFAYRRQTIFQHIDVDGTPVAIIDAPLHSYDEQFTNEIQINYNTDRINAVGGLFLLRANSGQDPFLLKGLALSPLDRLIINDVQKTRSVAVFGQATYEIVDGTNLTAGLRYTHDKRRLLATQEGDVGGTLITLAPPIDKSKSFGKVTWRLSADHEISQSSMVYGSYSRGFKSGLYNLSAPNDPVVEPETLDAFEVGIKSKLFDNRLRLNLSGFYYDYKNIQLTLIRGSSTLLLNAASSRIYGADLDFQWALSQGLSLQGGASWTHARYSTFDSAPFTTPRPVPPFGNITVPGDAEGNKMIHTPTWTANLAAEYKTPLAGGNIAVNLAYSFNSAFYWEPDNRVRQKAVNLVNGQVMWSTADDELNVRLWGRNIFNRRTLTSVNETAAGDLYYPSIGRTFGVSVGFKIQ